MSVREEEWNKGKDYSIRGLVNSQGNQHWLIMTELGEVRGGEIIDPYKEKQGRSKVEPYPYKKLKL